MYSKGRPGTARSRPRLSSDAGLSEGSAGDEGAIADCGGVAGTRCAGERSVLRLAYGGVGRVWCACGFCVLLPSGLLSSGFFLWVGAWFVLGCFALLWALTHSLIKLAN